MSQGMSLYQGVRSSVPQTDADIREALQTGLLSLDSNVLLDFYRYRPKAADDERRLDDHGHGEGRRRRRHQLDGNSTRRNTDWTNISAQTGHVDNIMHSCSFFPVPFSVSFRRMLGRLVGAEQFALFQNLG